MTERQLRDLDVFEWALIVALRAHREQTDKNGCDPYILHPLRVGLALPANDPELRAIGVLHDVIEDTELTRRDLERDGFSDRVCDALDALTYDRHQPYAEYVMGCGRSIDAWLVKRADVRDNANPDRLELLDTATAERLDKKYSEALEILEDCNPEGDHD